MRRITGIAAGGSEQSPAPVRRTQAEKSEATRTVILKVSAKLLRKKGVGGLRTSEVADAAKVSQGAQFHHFPTKNHLIAATVDFIEERFLARSKKRSKGSSSKFDTFDNLLHDAKDYYFSDYFLIELSVGITGEMDVAILNRLRERMRRSRQSFDDAWSEALEIAGLPADVARDLVALTTSIIRGGAIRAMLRPGPDVFDRSVMRWKLVAQAYLQTLVASGQAPAEIMALIRLPEEVVPTAGRSHKGESDSE